MANPPPASSSTNKVITPNPAAQAQLDKLRAAQEKASREASAAKSRTKKKKRKSPVKSGSISSVPSTPIQNPTSLPDQDETTKRLEVAEVARQVAQVKAAGESKRMQAQKAEAAEEKKQAEAERREVEAAEAARKENEAAEELIRLKRKADEEVDRITRENADRSAGQKAQLEAEAAIKKVQQEAEESKKVAEREAEQAIAMAHKMEEESRIQAIEECEEFKRITELEFFQLKLQQEASVIARQDEMNAQQDELRKSMTLAMEQSKRDYELKRAEDLAEAEVQMLRFREEIHSIENSRQNQNHHSDSRRHQSDHWGGEHRSEHRHPHFNHRTNASRTSSSPRRQSLQEVIPDQPHDREREEGRRPIEYEQVSSGHQQIHRPVPYPHHAPPRELTDVRVTIQSGSTNDEKLCFLLELATFTALRSGDMRVRCTDVQESVESQRGLVRRLESAVMGRIGVYQVQYKELFIGHWVVGKDVRHVASELSDPWLGSLPIEEVEGGSATPFELVLSVSHTSMW